MWEHTFIRNKQYVLSFASQQFICEKYISSPLASGYWFGKVLRSDHEESENAAGRMHKVLGFSFDEYGRRMLFASREFVFVQHLQHHYSRFMEFFSTHVQLNLLTWLLTIIVHTIFIHFTASKFHFIYCESRQIFSKIFFIHRYVYIVSHRSMWMVQFWIISFNDFHEPLSESPKSKR